MIFNTDLISGCGSKPAAQEHENQNEQDDATEADPAETIAPVISAAVSGVAASEHERQHDEQDDDADEVHGVLVVGRRGPGSLGSVDALTAEMPEELGRLLAAHGRRRVSHHAAASFRCP